MSRTMDGSASGFRSKLHSRAESFSLENLGIRSGKSGQESLQGSRRIRIGTKKAEPRREFESGKSGQKVWNVYT